MNLNFLRPAKNGLLSFAGRYGKLLVAFVIALILVLLPTPFAIVGTLVYLPVLALGSVLSALLIRHLFFKQTLDEDVHSGLFVSAWKEMPAGLRVIINLAVMAVLFIGACIIASAMIR